MKNQPCLICEMIILNSIKFLINKFRIVHTYYCIKYWESVIVFWSLIVFENYTIRANKQEKVIFHQTAPWIGEHNHPQLYCFFPDTFVIIMIIIKNMNRKKILISLFKSFYSFYPDSFERCRDFCSIYPYALMAFRFSVPTDKHPLYRADFNSLFILANY